jgi:hypothetical protein
MTERELNDTRLVWHCQNRHTKICQNINFCRGTNCKVYLPNKGSYHDSIEPIKNFRKKEGK